MDYIKFIRSKVGHERIFITCASILIQREDGKVLVETRTDNGMHAFPGGCQELDETIEQTALREAKEETGLDVHIVKNLGFIERFNFSWPNGDKAHTIVFAYLAYPTKGQKEKITDGESTSLKWMNLKEALNLCLKFEGEDLIKLYSSLL